MKDKKDALLIELALSRITFLSFNEKIILWKKLDSFSDLVIQSIEDIFDLVSRTVPKKCFWNGQETKRIVEQQAYLLEKLKISHVSCFDVEFPALLKEIPDPPFMLFYRGDISLLNAPCVSVVGTRNITPGGKEAAHAFSYQSVCDGWTVVSGLAHGVDTYAHKGALDAFADSKTNVCRTAAVIPCGIDYVVPTSNKKLAASIIEGGGVLLSECAPQVAAEKWLFVKRNRIIAGLSQASVVVEAPPGSGSLIEADFAIDYNRDVVIHEAAFSENARNVASLVRMKQECEKNASRKAKIENTLERYLDDGAPVIKNYSDFVSLLAEPPGRRRFEKLL